MPAYKPYSQGQPLYNTGEEQFPGNAGDPGADTGTNGTVAGASQYEGLPLTLRNGITYNGIDAANISDNPISMLDATLRGRNMLSPGESSYYTRPYQALNTLFMLSANPSGSGVQKWMTTLAQAEQETDPTKKAALIELAAQQREEAGLSTQSMYDFSDSYMSALQGGGIDPNKALGQLIAQSGGQDTGMRILLETGTPEDKANMAINMIMDTLVTSNPVMARLFEAILGWMARKWQTDPNASRSGSIIEYMIGRTPTYEGNTGTGSAATPTSNYGGGPRGY